MANRWYWRCTDCLSVVAIEQDMTGGRNALVNGKWEYVSNAPKCECGGRFTLMGKVQRARLVLSHERCACDHKCTNATGPNCDCSCGGVNHGTGRVVTVVTDEGGVPTVRGADMAVAEEFRAARKAAKERLALLPFADDYAAGRYIAERSAWERLRNAHRDYSAAKAYKTHKRRMAALAAVGTVS